MGRYKSRRNNRKQSSSTQIEPESPPAGKNLENGKIRMTALAPDNQSPSEILSGSNNLGDTQLVDDTIGVDEETQLVDDQYTSRFVDMEHDTELGTQLVEESDKECSDRDSYGTEVIGRLSDDEVVRGVVSADPNEQVAAASRCLSKHADKSLFTDADTSTDDESNLGSTQANSPSVYTSSLNTLPNKTQVDLGSDLHSTETEVKERQVWNENACMDELGESKARKMFDEDERNKLLFDKTRGNFEDVHLSKLGRREQVPELSYICSQEPGEFSQANALGVVDKLLDTVDGQLYVETAPRRNLGVKMASMSGAKGPQSLARRQDLKNPMESIGTYDWIDSREDEGGGDFFTRRRGAFFGNGHGRKSFTDPCQSKKLTSGKAEKLANTFQENKKGRHQDHESVRDFSLSDSRIGLSESVNLDTGQAKNAKVMRSLFGNFNRQEHTERLEELVEPPDHSGAVIGIHDVGVDTQIAAEAMQELGCRSPINSVDEDIPVIGRSTKKESKLLPDSSYLFKMKQPSSNSVNTEELPEQMKYGTRVGGKKHHSTTKCSRSLKDSLVEKRPLTKRSAKESCNTMNSSRRIAKSSKCLKKGREEDSDETWLYGSSGSIIDPSRSIEPVAHRTRNSIGKQCDKSENVFSNCKDGKGDQLDARITRRTRSSLVVASKRKRQVSSSIRLSKHMLNDAAITVMNKMQQADEEKRQPSSRKKKTNAFDITSSTYPKQVAVEQMASGIVHNVKARRQSPTTNVSSPPNVRRISSHLNGTGILAGDASASCFPCDGEVSMKKRGSSGFPSAHASMVKKPKKDFVHKKGGKFDTAPASGHPPANVQNENSPSAPQALTNSPSPFCCSMNDAETVKKDVEQISSAPTTPVKDVDAASPIYTMNGDDIRCYKTRSSLCPLSRELIRLDAIKPELSPILKDASRKKRDIASIRVLFSHHLGEDVIKQQKKIVSRLGISTASSSLDATHFVTDKFVRTRNMLESIALGKPVVTPSWLESCGQACCFIDEKKYILRDAKKEREIGFNMASSLVRASQKPLLQDHRVLVTQNVKPSKELIVTLVKAAHGLVVERVGRSPVEDLLIISCEEDRSICMPLLEKGSGAYSSELILNGLVIQKLEFDRHVLFMDNKKTRSSRKLRS